MTPLTALDAFNPVARGVIVAAAIAILVLAAKAAADLLAPMLLALFIAILAAGPLRWMRRQGVPKYLALAVVAVVLLDLASLIALVMTGALEGLQHELPSYQERLLALAADLGRWLEGLGVENADAAVPDLLDPRLLGQVVRTGVANASSVFGTAFLVLLAVMFMLSEAPALPAKLRLAFGVADETDARLGDIAASIKRYMLIKTLMSLLTATVIFAWLGYLGLGFAPFLTILAFFLNYIPFVGAVLMTVPAILIALVEADLATTGLVAAGYVVANTAIGSVLEPRVMGRGLGISTLTAFLSLVFWGWVFGTLGIFLSVPLTMGLITMLAAHPETRALAILLGPELPPPAPRAEAEAVGERGEPETPRAKTEAPR